MREHTDRPHLNLLWSATPKTGASPYISILVWAFGQRNRPQRAGKPAHGPPGKVALSGVRRTPGCSMMHAFSDLSILVLDVHQISLSSANFTVLWMYAFNGAGGHYHEQVRSLARKAIHIGTPNCHPARAPLLSSRQSARTAKTNPLRRGFQREHRQCGEDKACQDSGV